MTNEELIFKTEIAVKSERRSTSEVVRLFQEISKRKLFLERGFPNLYEMATKHFGYCAGSAMRRINAMRLLQEIPGVEAKIESGELSLSVASEVQSFFYSEAKLERPYSLNAKIELVETCLNKSRRDVERELIRRNPEREKRDVITQISSDRVRVSFSISEELNQKLTRLKELLSHTNPSTEELLDRLAEFSLDKFDPMRKAERARARSQAKKSFSDLESSQASRQRLPPAEGVSEQVPPEVTHAFEKFVLPRPTETGAQPMKAAIIRSRYIPSRERHAVIDHDKGCAYIDGQTGRRCGETKFLERDHIAPYSEGGSNMAENLRWLCSAHNKWRFERRYLEANLDY
jgi:hypothetical protein